MNYIYYFDDWIKKIEEGLISSYDIDKAIYYVDNFISGLNLKYEITKNENNTINVEIFDVYEIDLLKNVLDIIIEPMYRKYGWFAATSKISYTDSAEKYNGNFNYDFIISNHYKIKSLNIKFEAKFNKKIDEIPKILYHLSIKHYKNNILKKGLYPKSKSKIHNDSDGRIYLTDNLEFINILKMKMSFYYHDEEVKAIKNMKNKKNYYNKNTEWVVFEIDTDIANIKLLYDDPNSDGFYYTENIIPASIKIYDEE